MGRGLEWGLLQSRPTAHIYWNILPKIYRWRYGSELREYNHPPEPFRRLYVNPDRIATKSSRSVGTGVYKVGGVKDGDWDQNGTSVKEMSIFKAIKQRYEDGKDWSETPFIQRKLEKVQRGQKTWHGCTSEEDIFIRCGKLDRLFETLAKEGYKSQPELRNKSPSLTKPFGFFNEYINEIAVDIGRDGELLFLDGRHRFSMAHVLDIEKIPVAVIVRHEEWMKHRERIATGKVESAKEHPDLAEFTE